MMGRVFIAPIYQSTTLSFYWDTLLDGDKTSFEIFSFSSFLNSSSSFDDFSLVGCG